MLLDVKIQIKIVYKIYCFYYQSETKIIFLGVSFVLHFGDLFDSLIVMIMKYHVSHRKTLVTWVFI